MRATRARSAAQRPRPTWRGAGLALAGALSLVGAALYGRVDLLVLGLVLLLLPLAAAIAVTVDRPWISVARQFESDVVTAGEPAHVAVTVRNEASRRAPSLRWRDACPPGLTASSLAPLPPLGEHAARIAATITPPATPKNPRRVKLAPFCDGIVASF